MNLTLCLLYFDSHRQTMAASERMKMCCGFSWLAKKLPSLFDLSIEEYWVKGGHRNTHGVILGWLVRIWPKFAQCMASFVLGELKDIHQELAHTWTTEERSPRAVWFCSPSIAFAISVWDAINITLAPTADRKGSAFCARWGKYMFLCMFPTECTYLAQLSAVNRSQEVFI